MEKTYRVSLDVDLSSIELVDTSPDNVATFFIEVKADSALEAAFLAMQKLANDSDVISIVPIREG